MNLDNYPARVSRKTAMLLLGILHSRTFTKVVDANPRLVHRLPGEQRARYRVDEIARLLSPAPRCAAQEEGKKLP